MQILGIETSCDETGVALYDTAAGLLADSLYSQIDLHARYGGVVPEIASRDHIRHLLPLIDQTLTSAKRTLKDIDAIGYTKGPGLAGALLVGATLAETLAMTLRIPAIGIHHLEGHLLSPLLAEEHPDFPFVALLVSGGHTQFMLVKDIGQYQLMGETVDDAAGEAFDKTAKCLGLGYPGGPALAKLAEKGQKERFSFPRPMMHSDNLNMSFSGLKTAVITQIAKLSLPNQPLDDQTKADLCCAFEIALCELLTHKAKKALEIARCDRLVIAGGVGANQRLRQSLAVMAQKKGARIYHPPLSLCTDNGAMIALAAALRVQKHPELLQKKPDRNFSVRPRWPLEDLCFS